MTPAQKVRVMRREAQRQVMLYHPDTNMAEIMRYATKRLVTMALRLGLTHAEFDREMDIACTYEAKYLPETGGPPQAYYDACFLEDAVVIAEEIMASPTFRLSTRLRQFRRERAA